MFEKIQANGQLKTTGQTKRTARIVKPASFAIQSQCEMVGQI
jgi:hypothetical protein